MTAGASNGTILATIYVDGSAATNKIYSVWMKRRTGTGSIYLTDDNGSHWTEKTLTSSWAKYELAARAQSPAIIGIKIATSSDAIDVCFNQLEKSYFNGWPIPTNGCPRIVKSAAGNATGPRGNRWTTSAAVKSALAASGTLIATIIPYHAAATGSGTGSGLITVADAATGLLYYDYTNTNFESTDGTNAEENTEAIASGTSYRVAVRWNGTGGIAVDEKHGGTNTKETGASFDGSYGPGDYTWISYGNKYPMKFGRIQMFDGWVADANLDNTSYPKKSSLFPILPFFGRPLIVKEYTY